MKSSAKNIKLASGDDLFFTEESRADENREKVIDNEAMFDTVESIKQSYI